MNPTRIPARLRRQVVMAAQGRCAYCRSSEALMGVTFEIDHILPEAAGGETTADNLCLCCPVCNRHKADRLTAHDSSTSQEVLLFHPNHQVWSEHFTWSEDGSHVVGLTAAGRATVEALHMNRSQMAELRRYWAETGRHPPEENAEKVR